MPSSRKRNKGKDRKAKQQAKKEESVRARAHEIWRSFYSITKCDHGCGEMSDDHPVSSFMDEFYNCNEGFTASINLKLLFQAHTHIWTNESYRKLAIDTLVRIGTNMILQGSPKTWPLCLAQSIVVLEHYKRCESYYDGSDDIGLAMRKRMVLSKWRDTQPEIITNERDALKFYRKRTTCKCLKKMHLEARKTQPKLGICWHCKDERERATLSVCGRCKVDQYCSRECQLADWSKHKSSCDLYVFAHKHSSSE